MEGVRECLPSPEEESTWLLADPEVAASRNPLDIRLAAIKALPEAEQIQELSTLLTDGWFSDPAPQDLWLASEVLESMSASGRQSFAQVDGGAPYAVLMDTPVPKEKPPEPEEKGWMEWASEKATAVSDAATTAWNTAALAGESAINYALTGEVAVDLNDAIDLAGGSFGGMTLDHSAKNQLELTTDATTGKVEARIPSLSIEGLTADIGGTRITTGSGRIHDLVLTLDAATTGGPKSGIDASMGSLDWNAIQVFTSAMNVTIPQLAMVGLHLASKAAPGQADALTQDGALEDVKDGLRNMLPELFRSLPAVADGDAKSLGDQLRSNFGGSQNFTMSMALLSLPQGVQSLNNDGVEQQIDSLLIKGVSLSIEQADALDALKAERESLEYTTSRVGTDRLSWVEQEIAHLESVLPEKQGLEARIAARDTLTAAEQDRWIELDREFRSGIATVDVELVQIRGVDTEEFIADELAVTRASATLSASGLGGLGKSGFHNAGTLSSEKVATLDERLAERAGQPEPEAAEFALPTDVFASSTTEAVDARGVEGVGYGFDTATVMDLSGATTEDAQEVAVGLAQITEADNWGVDVKDGLAYGIFGERAGSEVAGYVDSAEVQGVRGGIGPVSGTVDQAKVLGASGYGDFDSKIVHRADLDASSVAGVNVDIGSTNVSMGAANVSGLGASQLSTSGGTTWMGHAGVEGLRVDTPELDVALRSASATGVHASSADGESLAVTANRAQGQDLSFDGAKVDANLGRFSTDGVAVEADRDRTDLQVQNTRASGLTVDTADGTAVDVDRARAQSAHLVVDEGGKHQDVSVARTNVDGFHLAGPGVDVGVASSSLGRTDLDIRNGAIDADLASFTSDGIQIDAGEHHGTVQHVGGTAAAVNVGGGAIGATLQNLNVQGTDYRDDEQTAGLEQLSVLDSKVDIRGGDIGATLGEIAGSKVNFQQGATSAALDGFTVSGSQVATTKDGTIATVNGSTAAGGQYTTATGITSTLTAAQAGASGVVLDSTGAVVGASTSDVDVSGIHVGLIRGFVPATVGGPTVAAATAAPAESTPFAAEPLAGMSGSFSARLPMNIGGVEGITLTIPAHNGVVSLDDISVKADHNAISLADFTKLASLRVVDGKGLMVTVAGIAVWIAMDSRSFSGLQSGHTDGGGKKGAIHLQSFVEGLSTATCQAELTEEARAELERNPDRARRREERRDRRDARNAERDARRAKGEPEAAQEPIDTQDKVDEFDRLLEEKHVDLGGLSLSLDHLKLGDGDIGTADYGAVLNDQGHEHANEFTLEGTLDEGLHLGANELLADRVRAKTPDGTPISMEGVGVRGLSVDLEHALTSARSIAVDVKDSKITAIRYGDTSKLPPI